MSNAQFYAHTSNRQGLWHVLGDHLKKTAHLARQFGERFEAGELAYIAGLVHDIGKFSDQFQEYLWLCENAREGDRTPPARGPVHSVFGAKLMAEHSLDHLAFAVMGHHAGVSSPARLKEHLRSAGTTGAFDEVKNRAIAELPELRNLRRPEELLPAYILHSNSPLTVEFFIRMLFSALVDADRLDTEAHFAPEEARRRSEPALLVSLYRRFVENQRDLMQSAPKTPVNRLRHQVYHDCLTAACAQPGVYKLTVPTGGGKTRSALGFALKHAVRHGMERIIFVAPYTTILEQTADVYKFILGEENVLEHYSGAKDRGSFDEAIAESAARARLAAENWDAPVIVTTSVQFFDSIFSNRPSSCRKVHNVANSVVVLDEVQTLPMRLLAPIVSVLQELVDHYHTTVVLSSATQPSLAGTSPYLEGFSSVTEIVGNPSDMFAALRRVDYHVMKEPISWAELARLIREHPQVLAIVNTRRDARRLWELLDVPDAFYLSTDLCGAHRSHILNLVRDRLAREESCVVVSTQMVEAGVDLDFPVVFRAAGPLDSIVQAAGRCNREGKLERRKVVVFCPSEGHLPVGFYQTATGEAEQILSRGADLHDPSVYEEYFRRLQMDLQTDALEIQRSRSVLDFVAVAEKFHIIEEDDVPVVVLYDQRAAELVQQALEKGPSRGLYREMQRYTVNLPRRKYEEALKEGLIRELEGSLPVWIGQYSTRTGVA